MPKFSDAVDDSQSDIGDAVRLDLSQDVEQASVDVTATPVKRTLDDNDDGGVQATQEIPKKVIKVEKE